jgi:hypothetical protein
MGTEPKYPIAISELRRAVEASLQARLAGGPPNGAGASPTGAPRSSPTSDPPKLPAGMAFGQAAPTQPTTQVFGQSDAAAKPAASATTPTPPAASTPAAAPASDAAKPVVRKSGRFLTPKERLPKGLPDWFLEHVDDDGQVLMSGFAARLTPEAAAAFARYDLNGDGIITPAECLKAEKQRSSSK